MLAIDVGALGLAIGAIWPAYIGALIPSESEPVERVEDHLLGGCDEAGAVGVLDAEDEFAVALFGVEIVDEADIGGADVGVACGRGSDADTYGGFGAGEAIRHKGPNSNASRGGWGF